MGEAIEGRLAALYDRFHEVIGSHPALFASFVGTILLLALLTLWLIWRREAKGALWSATAIVLVAFVFTWADDTQTHVYRIAALSDQLRRGAPSPLLVDLQTREAVPTFVHYNLLPYLLPVALNLVGLSALAAFKIAGCVQLVVMVLGVQVLIDRTSSAQRGASRPEPGRDYLVAVLFVTANYVYALWTGRAALGEFWVYALIPWVVVATLSAGWARWLTLLFFLQACAHPIVLAHGLACEAIVAYGLARLTLLEVARRWTIALAVALVLATPFWLPQVLWQGFIRGPSALPVAFADSFQTIGQLLDPKWSLNIGLWLPLAVLLMMAAGGARLSGRVWLMVASWLVLMALQSVYLRDVAQHIPTLSLSLFVWRLMLPAAFLAFGALLAGWRELAWPDGLGLVPLSMLAVMGMSALSINAAPAALPKLAEAPDDRGALLAHSTGQEAGIWGVREYWPNYTALPRHCPAELERATFEDLRAGVRAEKPFVAVRHGLVGVVDYVVDGTTLTLAACGDDLVIGPVLPNVTVRVSEAMLERLMWLRAVGFPAALLVILLFIPAVPRTRRSNGL